MNDLTRMVLAGMLAGLAFPATSVAAPGPQAPGSDTRDVRIYYLERSNPARSLKGAVASLVIERDSGESGTYLLPLMEPTLPEAGKETGMIRALVGTPYFVELLLGDGTAKPGREPRSAGHAAPAPRGPGQLLSAEEVLHRAHRGPCFGRPIPASILSGPYQATITLRFENETISSEQFQNPPSPPKDALAGARRDIDELWNRGEAGAKFMDLKPLTQELTRNLEMLSPTGFADDVGSFEKDRQWCLSMGRAIEKACDEGNIGLVQALSSRCKPRLQKMEEFLNSTGTLPEGSSRADSP